MHDTVKGDQVLYYIRIAVHYPCSSYSARTSTLHNSRRTRYPLSAFELTVDSEMINEEDTK
jgi:hypothetical protein